MNFDISHILYSLPAILCGLTVHEFFHAWTALKLGDATAFNEGRVTLNPLKHIDPFGFLFLLVAGFGWAKPVHFNPEKQKQRNRDSILIAIAGPLSNLVLGSLTLLSLKFFVAHVPADGGKAILVISKVMLYFGFINVGLFVFNMIPLPPLDGSHIILRGMNLPPHIEHRVTQFGSLALFAIIIIEKNFDINILPIGLIINAISSIFF